MDARRKGECAMHSGASRKEKEKKDMFFFVGGLSIEGRVSECAESCCSDESTLAG